MSSASIRERFAFTAIFNVGKIAISFLSGTLIARALGPENCGNYMFLMGSFLGVRQLLNLETSSAFYTFLCQKTRGAKFILSYMAWQGFQLIFASMLIGVIFPNRVIQLLWLNQDRTNVFLAFLAVFFSQQVLLTVTQIGESFRRTRRVQALNFVSALVQFLTLYVFARLSLLTVPNAFWILTSLSALSFIISFKFIPIELHKEKSDWNWKQMVAEYRKYCSPLVVHTIATFIYTFGDKWLLQRYGGPKQQGFYSVAFQFSVVGLFATDAMINIFWKETAETYNSGDRARLLLVYEKTTRFLFMFSAAISGLLAPWSREITALALGPAYVEMWPVLAIMFVYPIHTTINHLTTAMFYTTGKTREFAVYGIVFMAINLVVSYFILAPVHNAIPGLGMGALGMALKIVVLNMLWAVFTSLWVSRKYSFKFDMWHQFLGMLLCFGGGLIAVQLCRFFFISDPLAVSRTTTLSMMAVSCVIYFGGLGIICLKIPSILGFGEGELYEMAQSLYKRLRAQWGKR